MSRTGDHRCGTRVSARLQAGFTLIELLAVMSLIALVALAVVHAVWPGQAAVELRVTAEALAAYLRDARSTAIASGAPIAVLIDADQRTVFHSNAARAPRPPLAIASTVGISATTAEGARTAQGHAGIRFFANGSSTGGRIVLHRGAHAHEITVNWLTGRISASAVH